MATTGRFIWYGFNYQCILGHSKIAKGENLSWRLLGRRYLEKKNSNLFLKSTKECSNTNHQVHWFPCVLNPPQSGSLLLSEIFNLERENEGLMVVVNKCISAVMETNACRDIMWIFRMQFCLVGCQEGTMWMSAYKYVFYI